MPRDGYLRYESSIEQPRPDEAETIKTIVASIERTNVSSLAKFHRAIRQQHAKGQGFLRGELTVYDDLPNHLRQGMFALPRTPGGQADNQAYRPRRIGLCKSDTWPDRQRGGAGGQMQKLSARKLHWRPPPSSSLWHARKWARARHASMDGPHK